MRPCRTAPARSRALQTDLATPLQTHLLPQITHLRNPGMPLDLDWVAAVQANT